MKRVHLSCLRLLQEETVEDALWNALSILVTDSDIERFINQLYEKAKSTIIAVESLDMRLHPEEALNLVTFCYEYGFRLDLIGEKREALRDALVSAFESQNSVSNRVALDTIYELLNGEGKTLIKHREAKPFSAEDIPDAK